MTVIMRRGDHRWPKGNLQRVTEDVLRDGLRLTQAQFPVKWKWAPRLKDAHLEDVDLHSPSISGTLFAKGVVQRSVFRRVSFDDVRIKGVRFEHSIFESCIFSGALRNVVFAHCRFIDCAMGRAGFDDCLFADCDFAEVEMKESPFRRCRFARVTGTGRIEGGTILECMFADTDWSGMQIIDTAGLVRNRFERTRLPSRRDNFALNTAVFKTAYSLLNGRLSETGESEYSRIAEIFAARPALQVIDETWFDGLPIADRAIVMEVLYQMREREFE